MECILTLRTNILKDLHLNLHEGIQSSILFENKNFNIVYSDFDYYLSLKFDEDIESMQLFINDILTESYYSNGNIYFKDNSSTHKKIFMNYFGFVNISVFIRSTTGKTYEYYSDYLDVAIRDNITSEMVRKMILYISSNSYEFMFGEESNVKDFSDIKKSNDKNLYTEIAILENILYEYEENFKFFKRSSKCKLISNYLIDDFEKLKEIKSETIQYIISNPSLLTVVKHNTGIKYNKYNLQPKKTLINKNEISYDIYENQIVLGFLKYIYNAVLDKINEIDKRVIVNSNNHIINPYVSSANKMYEIVIESLKKHKNKLCDIKIKIQRIYFMYKSIFKCKEIKISYIPKPSHIFLEIQHYRKIYKVIKDWFESGNYNLCNEKMILSFSTANQIYEYYILLKLNHHIECNDFELNSIYKYSYILNRNAKYKNTIIKNTYIFEKDKAKITVYYQPVIYLDQVVNNIGLFRNNSVSISNEKSYYYTPDFVIKVEKDKNSRYVILDAKWSTLESVINYSFKDIIYKYVFSISTLNSEDIIDKIWVVNGKNIENSENYLYNFYNSRFETRCNEITPSAKIMTLNPYVDETIEKENLNSLFSSIL